MHLIRGSRFIIAFFLFLAAVVGEAHAQGCALCYTQAAASGNRMIHALRDGIYILVITPTCLSVLFTSMVYRKRRQFRPPEYTSDTESMS
jgi:hypothetical protein